jgi:hypothetical protein
LTPSKIQTLVNSGVLLRQAQGVYRVAAAPHSFAAALWVAALSTGGVFVATTAAYLWGIVAEHTGLIRVAVPRAVKVVESASYRQLSPVIAGR